MRNLGNYCCWRRKHFGWASCFSCNHVLVKLITFVQSSSLGLQNTFEYLLQCLPRRQDKFKTAWCALFWKICEPPVIIIRCQTWTTESFHVLCFRWVCQELVSKDSDPSVEITSSNVTVPSFNSLRQNTNISWTAKQRIRVQVNFHHSRLYEPPKYITSKWGRVELVQTNNSSPAGNGKRKCVKLNVCCWHFLTLPRPAPDVHQTSAFSLMFNDTPRFNKLLTGLSRAAHKVNLWFWVRLGSPENGFQNCVVLSGERSWADLLTKAKRCDILICH